MGSGLWPWRACSGQAGAGSGEARAWKPGRLGVPESDVKKFGQSLELLLWSRGPGAKQINAKLWRCRWGKYHTPGQLFYPGSGRARCCQAFGIKNSPFCHHYCDEVGSPCAAEFSAYVRRLPLGGGSHSGGAAAGGGWARSGAALAPGVGVRAAGGAGVRVDARSALPPAAPAPAAVPKDAFKILMEEQQRAHDAAKERRASLLAEEQTRTKPTTSKNVFPFSSAQWKDGFTNAHQVMCPPRMLLSSLHPASCLTPPPPLALIPPLSLTRCTLLWRRTGLFMRKLRTGWSTTSRRGQQLPTRMDRTMAIWVDSRASCIYLTIRVMKLCRRRRRSWERATTSLERSGTNLPPSLKSASQPPSLPAFLPACLPVFLTSCLPARLCGDRPFMSLLCCRMECRSGQERCAHLLNDAGVLMDGDLAMDEALLLHLDTFYLVFFLWEVRPKP